MFVLYSETYLTSFCQCNTSWSFPFTWAYRLYFEVMAFSEVLENFRAVRLNTTDIHVLYSKSVSGVESFLYASLHKYVFFFFFCYSLSVEPQKQGRKANFSSYIYTKKWYLNFHHVDMKSKDTGPFMLRLLNRLNCNSIWFPNDHRSEMKSSFSRILSTLEDLNTQVSDFASPEALFGCPPSKWVSLQGRCNVLDSTLKFKLHCSKVTASSKAGKAWLRNVWE